VAVAAEEAREEVKGVVAAAATAAVLVVLYSIVAITVVDLASFGVGEDFVGFGDFDELAVGSLITSVGKRSVRTVYERWAVGKQKNG
jgi:hypothetical protein